MKNKTGGSKHKRLKRVVEEKKLIYKEDDQRYAVVEKLLGNLMTIVQLTEFGADDKDKGKRTGVVCGGIKKRQRILVGDLVIVSLRDFEEDKEAIFSGDKKKFRKCDIIHKYNDQEVHEIKKIEPRLAKYMHNIGTFDNDQNTDVFAEEKNDIFDLDEGCSDDEEEERLSPNSDLLAFKGNKFDIDDI